MKKIASALISASLTLTMLPSSFAATFTDIDDESYSWAKPYIEDMASLGLISGYEDNTYRPSKEVSRLEAISLFARAMGSNSEENADVVELAAEKYASALEKYSLNFGTDEISYMLYRGALKESELDTYLKGDLKNEPMPRSEAAIIITKAMGAEEAAKAELMVDLTYTDAKSIPSKATQYVYYVTEQGIMSGMDDGSFSPATSVLRSQIAVMLSKTVDKMVLGFATGKISTMDYDNKNISVKYSNGDSDTMGYNDSTKFYIAGDEVDPSEIAIGLNAVLTYSDGKLLYVDAVSSTPDETVRGIYQGYGSTNGVVWISVKPTGSSTAEKYTCASDLAVIRDGSASTIRNFKEGDFVTIDLSNDEVQLITGELKTSTISKATVEAIDIEDELTITISHSSEEYNGATFTVANDVTVRKNGDSVDMSSIYKGDSVTLTLEYGVVSSIIATSSTKTVDGTIQSITISSTPKMTVSVNGTEKEYTIPTGVAITINGEAAQLYDFRVGDTVKITIDSDAITKIQATAVQSVAKNITGTVTAINTSYGFIKIRYVDGDIGGEEIIYCKDNTTKFLTSLGESLTMKQVKVDSVVTVRGTVKNGAFEATVVMVEAE